MNDFSMIIVEGFSYDQFLTVKEFVHSALSPLTLVTYFPEDKNTVFSQALNSCYSDAANFPENQRLDYIIKKEDPAVKFVCFAGLSKEKIQLLLENFPGKQEKKMIFFTPTLNNSDWTLSFLFNHLFEEDSAFHSMKGKKQ